MSSLSKTRSISNSPPGNERLLRFQGNRLHRYALREALLSLPPLDGRPLSVEIRPEIHVRKGRLVLHVDSDQAVHGAANIRSRVILLEAALLKDRPNFQRIFLHELFHFVWVRLSNQTRRSFEDVLRRERESRARGELGWSAEMRKNELARADLEKRSRKWREYCCESFCDTAAWWFGGMDAHPEHTLSDRYLRSRRAWYRNFFPADGRIAL